jgi:hypothetical protein
VPIQRRWIGRPGGNPAVERRHHLLRPSHPTCRRLQRRRPPIARKEDRSRTRRSGGYRARRHAIITHRLKSTHMRRSGADDCQGAATTVNTKPHSPRAQVSAPSVRALTSAPVNPRPPALSLAAVLRPYRGVADAKADCWTGWTAAGWGNSLSVDP